tara:strand:- start:124 stop:705 length:582 start_codon:yes stop_codon:yes gene_type:complete
MIYEPSWKNFLATTIGPVFSAQECETIINLGRQRNQQPGKVGAATKHGLYKANYRTSLISWIPFKEMNPFYHRIETAMMAINRNHFGFEGMCLTEQGQFTEYKKGGFYDWHMDANVSGGSQTPVRKVSMTILLSNRSDFDGGELEFFKEHNKPPPLQQGQAIFFASFIRHRVTKVTRGMRSSLVMWFGGPPFK